MTQELFDPQDGSGFSLIDLLEEQESTAADGSLDYLSLVESHGGDVVAAAGNLLKQEPGLIGKRVSDGNYEDLVRAIKYVEDTGWGLELF